ncbi:hypothetical protein F4824DRAFT_136350 [Ustulina deusta]|nr:hypothetical protein F4824DRAFT_136350 [Ustulina deusta]
MASSDNLGFEPRNIFAAIFQLGLGGESPVLEDEFRGGQCRIFKLNFRNKESLAVRVPLYMNVCSQFEKIPVVKMEVEILQMLEAKGFRWAPKCRGYSLISSKTMSSPTRDSLLQTSRQDNTSRFIVYPRKCGRRRTHQSIFKRISSGKVSNMLAE